MTYSVNVSVQDGLAGIEGIDFGNVAPKDSPTFTGNVYLPATTYIPQGGGNVQVSNFALLNSPTFTNPKLNVTATDSSADLAIANVSYVKAKLASIDTSGLATQSWVTGQLTNYLTADQFATTYASLTYVNSSISTAINNLINSAPGTLDTLGEIATALAADQSAVAALTTAINGKQAADDDLTAIAALTGTSGLLNKTAANTWSLDTNTYLTTSSASSTYLTQSNASSTYLTQSNASSTYAPIAQTMYIGTTAVAINRTSAALTLAGITLTAPTISGHATIEGVTPTGATGTGNMVFSASPTLTGTTTVATSITTTPYIVQGTPNTQTASITLTAANMLTYIIEATPAAAVTYTLPTGTAMDTALGTPANDTAFDWFVINKAGTNTFTITMAQGASGHTIVGQVTIYPPGSTAAQAGSASAHFRTRKTAANTYITYRLA